MGANTIFSTLLKHDTNEMIFKEPKKLLLCSMLGGKSHIKLHLEIGKELLKKGHQVKYASASDQIEWARPYNIGMVDLGENPVDDILNRRVTAALTRETLSFSTLSLVIHAGVELSYKMVYLGLKQEIEVNRPDFIICDYLLLACFDVASEMGVPFGGSFPTFGYVDQSMAPYITNRFELLPPTTDGLTLFQKVASTLLVPLTKNVLHLTLGFKLNKLRRSLKAAPVYGHSWKKLEESLIFVDTFFGFDAPRPIPPLVQPIGPIVSDVFPPLGEELFDFVETKQKLIYVAFGTIVYLENDQVKAILEGLVQALEEGLVDSIVWSLVSTHYSQLPLNISIREKTLGLDELLGNYPIKIVEYAPQVAILRHRATKIFLSHCGIESTFEGLLAGVPFLAVPFFGDQLTNAGNLQAIGVGIAVDRHAITKEKIHQAVFTLSSDQDNQFSKNVERMNRIAYSASFSKYKAADMIEQVMFLSRALSKTDSPLGHLVTRDNYMHWFFHSNLDIYTLIVLGISIFGFLLVKVISAMRFFKPHNSQPSAHGRTVSNINSCKIKDKNA